MDELNAYKAGLGVAPDSDKSPDNVTTPEQDAQTSFSNSSENIATQTDSNTPGPDNKTDAKEQSKHSSEDASKADISNAEAEQNANAETSSENETDKDFEKAPAEVKLDNSRSIHELMISDIDGKEIAFKEYKNRVVMLVNVASECGYTPQYRGLHVLHEKYRNRGFTVIGVPCNQFGGQEPGREAEIKAFCLVNYNVMFPLTSKIEVNGPRQHPLYDVLTGADAEYPGDISWNFEKFLIGKDGKVIKRYAPAVEPTSSEVIRDVEKALGQ
ncbi:MAG: glutathione peroxidase [Gammaproteobacteria bacterium]|nr:glutathione peroxidase [Gammaproteobacteria bacterium]NNM13760.1 glutathione peroxidase [Gammaproteobacteria bacterium]